MNYLTFSCVWLLLFVLMTTYCFATFKIGKTIIFTKADMNCNPKYITDCFIKVNDAGTPDSSLNIKVTIIQEFPSDANMNILLYKHDSADSKAQIGRTISHNYCTFIKNDKLFYPRILKHSNFPKTCPVQLMTYEINNYKVSLSDLPPMVWDGNLSVVFNISNKIENILSTTLFASIV